MAGIGGIGGSFSQSSLAQFVQGSSSSAGVTQSLNELKYGYGDILRGAATDGTIFDVRADNTSSFRFSGSLALPSAEFSGIQFGGREVSIDVTRFAANFEQLDVARRAWGLLRASLGEISEDDLNDKYVFGSRSALQLSDSVERLNIDADRPFTVNGVKFRVESDRLVMSRSAGSSQQDPEVAARMAAVSRRLDNLSSTGGEKRVKMSDSLVTEIERERARLEQSYRYIYYDFSSDELVGTNTFADYALGAAAIPDAYFFGMSVGYQLGYAVDDMPQNLRYEVIQQAGAFFGDLVVGSITNVPPQTIDGLFSNLEQTFAEYGFPDSEAADMASDLRLRFEVALDGVLDSLETLPADTDLGTLRDSLGIRYSGGMYTVKRFI